jgi:hypothetical protein
MSQFRLTLISTLAAASVIAASPTFPRQQAPTVRFPRNAVVEAVGRRDGRAFVSVRYEYGSLRQDLFVDGPVVPRTYQALVGSGYIGPCSLGTGDRVVVSSLGDVAIMIGENISPAPTEAWRLQPIRICYAVLYFDLAALSGPQLSAQHDALAVVLRGLSIAEPAGKARVWVRDSAKSLLWEYVSPGWLSKFAIEQGYPGLARSERPLRAILTADPSRVLLAQIIPARYGGSLKEMPSGGHPFFVVAAYEDRAGQVPRQLADFSASLP